MASFWFGDTQTELISRQIASDASTGKSQEDFLTSVIAEFDNSDFYAYMGIADRYYSNDNDIREAKRTVISKDANNNPVLTESKVLANNKLAHNFMKKLTRQKIAYMLGKPFSFASRKQDDEISKKFFDLIEDEYFDDNFFRLIKNIGRDAIVKGMGWLLVYYDETGKLKFKRCEPEEIIPLWADSDHTELDAVIRRYTIEQYVGSEKKLIKYIDYYTHEGVYHYVRDTDGKLKINEETGALTSDFTVKIPLQDGTGEKVEGAMWLKIPFIPFKYDPDEKSLLKRVKSLIDDYDQKTSFVSNIIDDFPNSTTVIKNYDGASKEEFVHNKNNYRTIFVSGDGDAKTLETKLNIAEIDAHIQRLRVDIYEFGQGVNTADKDIRDTSGVALRFMYADLDMDCIDWANETEWSIKLLTWFIQQDIMFKTNIDYSSVKYSIVFNTDVIVNETETIQNCFTSVGLISNKTIANNHPWVVNAEKEVDALLEDQETVLDLESEYATPTASNPAQGKRTAKNTK